jgi:hypothetical protein
MVRSKPDEEPQHILVLATLGAPERRLLKGRRGTTVQEASPEPVPTSRATVIHPRPFTSPDEAAEWLAARRSDDELTDGEVAHAIGVLNRALHAHRAARADAHARDVTAEQALVVRLGFGPGDSVAEGRYSEAWELPRPRRKTPRSMEAPEERFAALLGGRERALACEELVLRARTDVDAGRLREAALQARVALECLLSELDDLPSARRSALDADRGSIGSAANAALHGELEESAARSVAEAVERMEAALRAVRVRSAM